mgnify:CR=1 FL=1
MNASTGEVIKQYLEDNNFSLADLAESSNVSLKTIYRIISDESKLSYEVAIGLNKIIPEISIEFILGYDAKYQIEKNNFLKENDLTLTKCNELVSKFHLKKLYPDWLGDNISLIKQGITIFGKNRFLNGVLGIDQLQNVAFSKANNNDESVTKAWLYTTYYECNDKKDPLAFDNKKFMEEFKNLKKICGITNFESAVTHMLKFCNECGINFYFRKSIPNARVKAVTIKDKFGKVYIFMSDLFKCVENMWLAFIHECIHISKGDLNTKDELLTNSIEINERYVDKLSSEFLLGVDIFDLIRGVDIDQIYNISKKSHTPIGLVVEIYRFKFNEYNNSLFNQYLHFFSGKSVDSLIKNIF